MKPMLSATFRPDQHTFEQDIAFPVLAGPKLDGIRAMVIDGQLVSRTLKTIPNVFTQQALGNASFNGLDGELICGLSYVRDTFRKTTSAVMSEAGEPPITFWIFDNWERGQDPYAARLKNLPAKMDLAEGLEEGYVRIRRLKHQVIRDSVELESYEEWCLQKGYEGVMIRDPNGLYKFGRSTMRERGLIKIKRFEDSEAEIIGLVEQMMNNNEPTTSALGRMKRSSHKENKIPKGTTGTLQVKDLKTGVEFEIGTGMDESTRLDFWNNPPVGKVVKYKFQPTGGKDKPRFPVFLGLRAD